MCSYLHAADAVYHKVCSVNFRSFTGKMVFVLLVVVGSMRMNIQRIWQVEKLF